MLFELLALVLLALVQLALALLVVLVLYGIGPRFGVSVNLAVPSPL